MCGPTAVVSSWYGNDAYGNDASVLNAIASPVISDQQLRRCLIAPGDDACLAAAMWPTFYTHTLQSCPEGWTMTAMGVCHNPALPWRCPNTWTRLALPPFCSPNGLESESIPSLKCYAVRYADLRGPFCPYGTEAEAVDVAEAVAVAGAAVDSPLTAAGGAAGYDGTPIAALLIAALLIAIPMVGTMYVAAWHGAGKVPPVLCARQPILSTPAYILCAASLFSAEGSRTAALCAPSHTSQ